LWSFPALSAVSGHPLYCVRSLWSSPALCRQSLVIPCTVSAVSGHPLHCVRSLWSSPALCPQSLVISCTMFAVTLVISCQQSLAIPLHCVPCTVSQSLVIPCTVSAVLW
ncbi:unnamed protein product, partial [Staurois parvus]